MSSPINRSEQVGLLKKDRPPGVLSPPVQKRDQPLTSWRAPLIALLFCGQAGLLVHYLRAPPPQAASSLGAAASVSSEVLRNGATPDPTADLPPEASDGPPWKKKLRIAVISATSEYEQDKFWEEKRDYLEQLMINRECYTHLHGYDNIFDTVDHVKNFTFMTGPKPKRGCHGMCTIDDEDWKWEKTRMPGYWNKVHVILKHMEDYDYIVWTDADVFFVDLAKSVEWFINQARMRGLDAHIWLPQDQKGAGEYLFSNAVFIIRNSPIGRYAIQAWWDYGTGANTSCTDRWFRVQQPGHDMNLDMPWMWHAMLMVYTKYHDLENKCNTQCLERTIANCYRDYFREQRYPIAHKGRKLEKSRGPIVFSDLDHGEPRDTGIMLQGNWGPYQDNEHADVAWTIHSKRGRSVHQRYLDKFHRVCTDLLKCTPEVSRDEETKEVTGKARCAAFDHETLGEARRRLAEPFEDPT